MLRLLLALLLLALLLATGCRESSAPADPNTPPPRDTPEDRADVLSDSTLTADSTGLILADQLALGASIEEMREVLPASEMAEDEPAADTLASRATAPYHLFGRPGEIAMHFDDGLLASYSFHLDSLGCASADSLYTRLRTAYGERFGPPQDETRDGADRSTYWVADSLGVSATRAEQAGVCSLAWGFQSDKP